MPSPGIETARQRQRLVGLRCGWAPPARNEGGRHAKAQCFAAGDPGGLAVDSPTHILRPQPHEEEVMAGIFSKSYNRTGSRVTRISTDRELPAPERWKPLRLAMGHWCSTMRIASFAGTLDRSSVLSYFHPGSPAIIGRVSWGVMGHE